MAEHDDHDDLQVDPELHALLGELDYDDAGPPAGLRARTLGAVSAQPMPGHATERRRTERRKRGISLPYAVGGAVAVAAVGLVALLFTFAGLEGDAPRTTQLSGSAGAVTVEIRDTEVTLEGHGEPLPAGAEYELWAIQGDPDQPKLTSVGTFRPDAEGKVDAELQLPKGMPQKVPLAVTQEEDDDPSPNLPPVLAVT
ncbi:MAG: anti-sigma factor domain-containing protein [Solirubrobacteraceae bacterium]